MQNNTNLFFRRHHGWSVVIHIIQAIWFVGNSYQWTVFGKQVAFSRLTWQQYPTSFLLASCKRGLSQRLKCPRELPTWQLQLLLLVLYALYTRLYHSTICWIYLYCLKLVPIIVIVIVKIDSRRGKRVVYCRNNIPQDLLYIEAI